MVTRPIFYAESNGAVGGPLSTAPTDVLAVIAAAAIFPQSTRQHSLGIMWEYGRALFIIMQLKWRYRKYRYN
jgi:hypothetical protein